MQLRKCIPYGKTIYCTGDIAAGLSVADLVFYKQRT